VLEVKDASGFDRAYLLMEQPGGLKLVDEPANLVGQSYGRHDEVFE
jgi:hypothetical protein